MSYSTTHVTTNEHNKTLRCYITTRGSRCVHIVWRGTAMRTYARAHSSGAQTNSENEHCTRQSDVTLQERRSLWKPAVSYKHKIRSKRKPKTQK